MRAVEQRHVLRLAAEDMDRAEAIKETVLQILQFLTEHDRARLAIAIDQRHFASRLSFQRRADDRQHRRDAGAGGDHQVIVVRAFRHIDRETALRRHHLDGVAGIEPIIYEGGEQSAIDLLDADAQAPFTEPRTDRIGSPHVLAANGRAQRQVLAGPVTKQVAQILGKHRRRCKRSPASRG